MNGQETGTEWANARIGDVCEIIRGVTYKRTQANSEPCPDVLPILRATNIQENVLKLDDDLVYVPKELVAERQHLKVGDIVVATSSGSKHLVGKAAQLKEQWVGSFGAFCTAIRPSKPLYDRYIGYYFDSPFYRKYITAKSSGVNINNLRRGDLEEIVFPLAPLDQQKSIVEEIERQFSRLDEAVANLKRVKANLKRYKASVLQAAVTGKLTEEWRKQHPDVQPASKLLERILTERRQKWEETELAHLRKRHARGQTKIDENWQPKNDQWKEKYKEPVAPDTSGQPKLPTGWAWTSTEQLGFITGGLTQNKKREQYVAKVPFLRVANVYANELRLDEVLEIGVLDNELERVLLKKDDLLVVEGNGSPDQIGRLAIWDDSISPCVHQNHLIKVRLLKPDMGKLILYWLLSLHGRECIKAVANSTTGLYTLSISKVSHLPSPLVPIQEQQAVIQEVECRLSVAEKIEQTVYANLKRTERLRQSILKQAFSGELV